MGSSDSRSRSPKKAEKKEKAETKEQRKKLTEKGKIQVTWTTLAHEVGTEMEQLEAEAAQKKVEEAQAKEKERSKFTLASLLKGIGTAPQVPPKKEKPPAK